MRGGGAKAEMRNAVTNQSKNRPKALKETEANRCPGRKRHYVVGVPPYFTFLILARGVPLRYNGNLSVIRPF
jgi:hypothetical protein